MRLTIHLLICLSSVLSFGQTFEGSSTEEYSGYHCLLKISSDSSINYIYDRDHNGVYAEYTGEIEKKSDSLFTLKAKLSIGQYYTKTFNSDTLYIQLDSDIGRSLDKIVIEYSNNKNREQYQGYDRYGEPISLLKIPIDKELFNSKEGTNYVEIKVNRKNQITGEWLSFFIPFGSAAYITKGADIEFDFKMRNGVIQSIGKKPLQTGHIILEKK